MNVLMIGLGSEVLTGRAGDVRSRHECYGRLAGHLTMVVSSWKHDGLRPTRLSGQLMVYPSNSSGRLAFLWDAWRLASVVCRKSHVDLIVTQDPFATGLVGWCLKRRFQIPLLIGNHSFFFDNPEWISEKPAQYRLFNRLGKWLISQADGLRVVNPAEREKYIQYGVAKERIRLLPTPVPLTRFFEPADPNETARLRNRFGLEGRRVLLWVGSLHEPVKDLHTLFRATSRVVQKLPDVSLMLVGELRSESDLPERAKSLGLEDSVVFTGRIPHEDLPHFYALSDLYVHSSRYEGLAKVMLEAAASGRAIVSTSIPGIEAIVKDGENGLLSPVGDAQILATNITALLADAGRARRMGEAGRTMVQARYSPERMSRAVVDWWRDVAQIPVEDAR